MLRVVVILIGLLICGLPAAAEDLCRADVNSTELVINRDALGVDPARPGLRERASAWPGRGLSRLAGRPPVCDSETLFTFLATKIAAKSIADYCLLPDERLGYLLVPGARAYNGRCARTTCEQVNAAKSAALNVAGTATDIVTSGDVDAGETRTNAVLHASGAAILTGTAANVLASLGAAASTAMSAALAAPALAGAATVSVVAVGGAVFLCR